MINGIQDIYYNVQNMEKAVAFYSDTLNMTKVFGDEHWTSLQLGELKVGLHATEDKKPVPTTPRDSHGQHCGGTLTLKSDNIKEDREVLEKAGAKILGEADAPWGHMLVFEDFDGNVLKLMNPKY